MKYFLTRATGFVGGRLARQLREAGHTVNAVVRNPAKATALEAIGVVLFPGDVANKESLRAPMAGTDGVFHVAGWYKLGVKDKSEGERVNVQGTRNVLEVMREVGVPKGVYTSTLAAFSDTGGKMMDESYRFTGKHLSEYDRTKAAAHDIADEFIRQGLPLVIVQPGMIYGPGDTSSLRVALRQYLKRQLPMLPARQTMCWAHVDDIARAHILAMEKGKPGETYIIAGPPHSLIEFYQIAEEITGVPAPKMHAPPGMMKVMTALTGALEKLGVPVPEQYTAEYLREIAGNTYLGSNAKAKRELGYEPRPLREGLRETLEHEMKQGV